MIRTVLAVDQAGLAELINNGSLLKVDNGFQINKSKELQLMQEDIILFEDDVDGKTIRWNPAKERDPRVSGNGNAGEQSGFRFSPFYHEKGQFLQNIVKKSIIKTINVVHGQITKGYDVNAYCFDDPRLNELNIYFSCYISQFFCNLECSNTRKLEFMLKVKDIVMFLMKEDIYYRARFLQMFAGMPRFEITEHEAENIKRWR